MNRNNQTRKGKDNQRQRKHDEHRRPNVRNEKEQSRKEISLYHKEPKEKKSLRYISEEMILRRY